MCDIFTSLLNEPALKRAYAFICRPAARLHRSEGGGDGGRTHSAPAGGGHSDPAGGGRDSHRLRQQRAAAHHPERPGAALPAETLTSSRLSIVRFSALWDYKGQKR